MTDNNLSSLERHLLNKSKAAGNDLPPVHLWNPELSGDMDLVIKSNGQWVHEGDEIRRPALVRLFASIIKHEQDQYFLVTPVEKWRIQVESYPLFCNELKVSERDHQQVLTLSGPCVDSVVIDDEHPLWVEQSQGQPLPVVAVRSGLNAVISRNVYYQLADMAEQAAGDYLVRSCGSEFSLQGSSSPPS
ncbi:DUF1285 domain-containing protein [Halioxenophilus aromaticivorans]|uniref:DUF1285 domain-containing protein n=1 Tax=Halioxenophilus aromaticivorans TaxID=1306992 RepID=A0AAV3TXY4_9ALTE